jgi:hypothetical protein
LSCRYLTLLIMRKLDVAALRAAADGVTAG